MKYAGRMAVAFLACLLVGISVASAQVMKFVPSSTLGLMKVTNLEATSKKVADLSNTLGINQMVPQMQDPLGALLSSAGGTEGVNRGGDLVVAYINPDVSHVASDDSVLLLVPVSDYQKFLTNFPDAKTEGDITTATVKNSNKPSYIAHWGDYAAMSGAREIVATPPTDTLQVDGLAAKELDSKDIVLVGNLKGLRPKMLQAIDQGRQQAPDAVDHILQTMMRAQPGHDMTKLAPMAKLIANQALDLAQEFANDATAATLSFNLSPDGIATTGMCQFDPSSPWGQQVAGTQNSDASMLEGLPAGKYLLFGGGKAAAQLSDLIQKHLPPIEKEITNLGPDYTVINDWLDSVVKTMALSTGGSFGMMMPTAQPGAGALIQLVGVQHGDAKGILDQMRAMYADQQQMMKVLGVQPPNQTQTYTKDSKIVDGVSFDEMKTTINMNNPQNQQQAIAMQFINLMYGPQGPDVYYGVVNDQTMLTVMGLDDTQISTAIAAAKAGNDPLAKTSGVKTVAAQLPAQRIAAFYTPLDLWATTGLGYAKMFGIDMGVVLPDNLPPLGSTLSTDGPAVRADYYMPSQLLQALTSAGMQVYMKTQNMNHQPANGGAGAPGGM